MAEWIEVPAIESDAISERELRDDFDYIGENGRLVARGEIPYRFVRKKDGKVFSGPASLRNIPKFITARRSKRSDFMELSDQVKEPWRFMTKKGGFYDRSGAKI